MTDRKTSADFNGKAPAFDKNDLNKNEFDKAIFNQDVARLKELLAGLKLPKEQKTDFLTDGLRKACSLVYHDAIDLGIVDALIDAGGKVNQARGREISPFGIVCQAGDVALLRHLIARGGDVNADVNTDPFGAAKPLHLACGRGQDPAVVAELLRNKADPNAKGYFEQTPLHLVAAAAEAGREPAQRLPVVDLLLRHGAKVNATDKWDHTPLFSLLSHSPDIKIAERLIDAGTNLRHNTRGDGTALHLAAERGLHDVVDLLVRKGAPLLARNAAGYTPHQHLTALRRAPPQAASQSAGGAQAARAGIDFARTEALLQAAEDNIKKRDVRNFVKHKWSQWKQPRP